MTLTRRAFLRTSSVVGLLGLNIAPSRTFAAEKAKDLQRGKVTTTICPYCAVGCSAIVNFEERDGKRVVVNTEGDPDHPINEGALCPKGASLFQLTNNPMRLSKVLYRAPGSIQFEEKDWGWAVKAIAERIKKTRDATFMTTNAQGQTVNRTSAIASVGSAALDNEECWLYQTFLRALGLVYIEHQARLCHSSTVASLAASFGRGAMTNHWIDLKNADVVLIMGSNPAENHPISFRWVLKAKENGAQVISVDPRFTKSSAHADVYARLRSGTDIAFLGGMIKYILDNDLLQKEYALHYTNAANLIKEGFAFDPVTGFFTGYDPNQRAYDDKSTWMYQTKIVKKASVDPKTQKEIPAEEELVRDPTLQDPRCVYQLLKKHFARYDPETVSQVTGTPVADLKKVYETYASTGKPDRVGTIMYAMGWTQHTVGTQNIRAMGIIQLLLGNMGLAGGGVNAMRGESNVQGSTDHGLLFHILPGYLKQPIATQATLADYNKDNSPPTVGKQSVNWWGNTPKYITSFLKAMFGENATPENDFGYVWLPKIDKGANLAWLNLFDDMYHGRLKGLFAWGMNPACSSANASKIRQALTKLDWMVNVQIFPNETGWFWQDPTLGIRPEEIKTEVFVLPAAASLEKEGSISNSGRWMQWRYKSGDAPGDAKPDGDIIGMIFAELRQLYQAQGGACPEPILKLKWDDYFKHGEFDPHAVAKAINGYATRDFRVEADNRDYKKGDLIDKFAHLQADGSTSSGCWIYSGSYTAKGNLAARRKREEPGGLGHHPEWSWSWPVNRRIIYNRASVDPSGKPWDAKRKVVSWVVDEKGDGKWVGDVIDGAGAPPADAEKGKLPFIMNNEGLGRLFAFGLADGPFPEHYEPLESPITKNPFNGASFNPAAKIFGSQADKRVQGGSAEFPYVCSTYRVTEHWQTGVMTRHTPWLLEALPEVFVELSQELAREKGIQAGDKVKLTSARGSLMAVAVPTMRLKPMMVNGKLIHHVGLPWCFGWKMPEGGRGGDSANLLTPTAGDAVTLCPETKTFLVNIQKA